MPFIVTQSMTPKQFEACAQILVESPELRNSKLTFAEIVACLRLALRVGLGRIDVIRQVGSQSGRTDNANSHDDLSYVCIIFTVFANDWLVKEIIRNKKPRESPFAAFLRYLNIYRGGKSCLRPTIQLEEEGELLRSVNVISTVVFNPFIVSLPDLMRAEGGAFPRVFTKRLHQTQFGFLHRSLLLSMTGDSEAAKAMAKFLGVRGPLRTCRNHNRQDSRDQRHLFCMVKDDLVSEELRINPSRYSVTGACLIGPYFSLFALEPKAAEANLTEDQQRICAWLLSGLTLTEISLRMGRSMTEVREILDRAKARLATTYGRFSQFHPLSDQCLMEILKSGEAIHEVRQYPLVI